MDDKKKRLTRIHRATQAASDTGDEEAPPMSSQTAANP